MPYITVSISVNIVFDNVRGHPRNIAEPQYPPIKEINIVNTGTVNVLKFGFFMFLMEITKS